MVTLPLLMPRRKRGYTDQRGTLVVTATRKRDGTTWKACNLSAWPRRAHRAGAFLDELTAIADHEGATIDGRAGARDLLDKLYRDAGFTPTSRGPAPKIRRNPRDGSQTPPPTA